MSVNQLKQKISELNVELRAMKFEHRQELSAKDVEINSLRRALETAGSRYNREVLGLDTDGTPVGIGLSEQLSQAHKRIRELEHPNGTPANNHPEGEDPFVNYLDKERRDLMLGEMTDDNLANAVYLFGNSPPDIESVIAGTAKMPIVYLTAAKERIRWLSRRLLEATTKKSTSLET